MERPSEGFESPLRRPPRMSFEDKAEGLGLGKEEGLGMSKDEC